MPAARPNLKASIKGAPSRAKLLKTAEAHLSAGRLHEALGLLEQGLTRFGEDAAILFLLGTTARRLDLSEAAISFFSRVLRIEPGRREAILTLAAVYREAARFGDAIALLQPAVAAAPEDAGLWLALGTALRESDDLPTARVFLEEARRLAPKDAKTIAALADLTSDEGREDAALELYDEALALAPKDAQLRLNRALLALHLGRSDQGWTGYEARLSVPGRMIAPPAGLRRWDAAGTLAGTRGTVLLLGEQGIGDQLWFASCLGAAEAVQSAAYGTLRLEVEPRLVALLARSFPQIDVRPFAPVRRGDRLHYEAKDRPACAAWLPLGSLPGHFLKELQDDARGYLRPCAEQQARWRDWLQSEAGARGLSGPRLGIAWRSGKGGAARRRHMAGLEAWARMARTWRQSTGGPVVALQYDAQDSELEALRTLSGGDILVPEGLDQRSDIDGACALISALDRVVGAPISVTTQAAALGVPTAKLVWDKAWNALGREIDPFAPSCRILSPRTVGASPGDWGAVFSQAEAWLSESA